MLSSFNVVRIEDKGVKLPYFVEDTIVVPPDALKTNTPQIISRLHNDGLRIWFAVRQNRLRRNSGRAFGAYSIGSGSRAKLDPIAGALVAGCRDT